MLSITPDVAIAMMQTVVDLPYSAGPGTATVSLFSGPVPLTVSDDLDAEDNAHIVTFEFEDQMFGDPAEVIGESTVEAIAVTVPTGTAETAGDITFFRIYNVGGNPIMQGLVSEDEGANPEMLVNQITVTVGAEVSILRLAVGMAY